MAGYAQTTGGYGYYKPPPAQRAPGRSLALAASGKPTTPDPFGLLTDTTDSAYVASGKAKPPAAAPTAPPPNPTLPAGFSLAGGGTGLPPGQSLPIPGSPAWSALIAQEQTPATKPFDINTDPTYGEALALAGKSDADAASTALAAKEQTLLGYGDPKLAGTVLGTNDPFVQAAANNPTSTLANLADQRTRNTHDLTESLNKDNLAFGGYRITQEDQQARDYQNALATAAANVNGALGSIDSQLGSTLDANGQQRIQAALAAYAAHKGDTGGTVDTTSPSDTTPSGGNDTTTAPPLDITDPGYLAALALAARTRKAVAV